MPHNLPAVCCRRQFLQGSTAMLAGAALGALPGIARSAHVSGSDELKVALIGCGGRGTGVAAQALNTAGPVKLWAMADAFADRLQISLKSLTTGAAARYDADAHGGFAPKVDVPPERQFVGLDAYRKAIDSGADVVILATPPGFRPSQFEYAVKAGKHVFLEKPVATDAPGVRQVLAAADEAQKKGLKVGVGLQRHHQAAYIDSVKRIQDGGLGKLLYLRCYWNQAGVSVNTGERGSLSEMEYQVRHWYFFTWLSGDHIAEQHIHNLDVCNWVANAHPVEAQGMGGRQVRTDKLSGQIYDHHAVEFTYADGTKLFSYCRQIPGCWNEMAEFAHGTTGSVNVATGTIQNSKSTAAAAPGSPASRKRRPSVNPYQTEHDDLFAAIRNDKPYNEAHNGATSTMTAILGRMATYSGKVMHWDEALNSTLSLAPEALTWDAKPKALPDAEGRYPVAIPGTTSVL